MLNINDNYSICLVVANYDEEIGGYGDIYNSIEEMKKEHPEAKPIYGFCVMDTRNNCVPDECNDWNATVEDAINDYEIHCC